MSGAFDAAKQAADETKEAVAESRRQVSEAVDAIAGGPAKDVGHAETQITDLRARLQNDIDVLRDRVPDKDDLVARGRTTGLAAAGGLSALTLGVVALRRRGARRSKQSRLTDQARAIAQEIARLEREGDLPEDDGDDGGGRGRRLAMLALLAAGAGVAVWARMRRDDLGVGDLEAGIEDEVARTPDVEGGMVDLGGTAKR